MSQRSLIFDVSLPSQRVTWNLENGIEGTAGRVLIGTRPTATGICELLILAASTRNAVY
ncbi:MAG: hypothetical protein JWN70_3006 [Planctomycetaceae bacterium]|nr:hypothetical protein [Planctomycetaceae bacterium]